MKEMTLLQLYFLGTGAGIPSRQRNVTAIALILPEYKNETWLFDCGEATQHQILDSPVRMSQLSHIFITHLHGDHLFGLPGVLSSRSSQGVDTPLSLYGPPGIRSYVETSLRISETHMGYPLNIHEIYDRFMLKLPHFTITTRKLNHGIVSFGYRLVEKDKPGRLQAQRLQELGIPSGPIYQQLKTGQQVLLADGRVIDGNQFLDPPQAGRILAILGDTRPTASSIQLAEKANLLVHESTFGQEESQKANQFFHTTTVQAAEIAKKAGVKALVLTHISSRYSLEENEHLQKEASAIFPATKIAHDGWSTFIPRSFNSSA